MSTRARARGFSMLRTLGVLFSSVCFLDLYIGVFFKICFSLIPLFLQADENARGCTLTAIEPLRGEPAQSEASLEFVPSLQLADLGDQRPKGIAMNSQRLGGIDSPTSCLEKDIKDALEAGRKDRARLPQSLLVVEVRFRLWQAVGPGRTLLVRTDRLVDRQESFLCKPALCLPTISPSVQRRNEQCTPISRGRTVAQEFNEVRR